MWANARGGGRGDLDLPKLPFEIEAYDIVNF